MQKGWFLLILFVMALPVVFADTNVGTCRTIGPSDTDTLFTLNTSLVSAGNNCINITINNVVLDLNGFSISSATASDNASIFVDTVTTNVTIRNGIVNNSVNGIFIFNSSGVNITNITAANNTQYGFYLNYSSNNLLVNNFGNNNSLNGFFLTNISNNNNLTSNYCSYTNSNISYGCYRVSSSNSTNFKNNEANISYYGFYFDNATYDSYLSNNTAYNISFTGFDFNNDRNSIIVSNMANRTGSYGYSFISTLNASLENNTGINPTLYNFYFVTSNNNTLVNNSAASAIGYGLLQNTGGMNLTRNKANSNSRGYYLYDNSINNTLVNNSATSGTYGFLLELNSHLNVLVNNTVRSSTNHAFYLQASSNNTLLSNDAIGGGSYGFYINASFFNNITYANATNNSLGGIFLEDSNASIINITLLNNSRHQIGLDNSILNLSGRINITNTTLNAFDMVIENSSLVNNVAITEIITDLGGYIIDNATNISIKTLSLSQSGATQIGCVGADFSSCTLITNSSSVLNITNTSTVGRVNLTMFYNTTRAGDIGASSGEIKISKYTTGWVDVGQTLIIVNKGKIVYNPLTSFTVFRQPKIFGKIMTCQKISKIYNIINLLGQMSFSPGILLNPEVFADAKVACAGWKPINHTNSLAKNGQINYGEINTFSLFGVTRFVPVSSSSSSGSSESSGGGSGGGSGSSVRTVTISSDLSKGLLSIPDSQQEQAANNFVLSVSCNVAPCQASAQEVEEKIIPQNAVEGDEFLGAVQLECQGEIGTTSAEFDIDLDRSDVTCGDLVVKKIYGDGSVERVDVKECKIQSTNLHVSIDLGEGSNVCSIYLSAWKEGNGEVSELSKNPGVRIGEGIESGIVPKKKSILGIIMLAILILFIATIYATYMGTKKKISHY